MAASTASEREFHILAKVATPSITPQGDLFTISVTLTFSCSTPNATMYFTTDGSDPTDSSLSIPEKGVFVISSPGPHVVKVFAEEPHMLASDIYSKLFTVQEQMALPQFQPPEGDFVGDLWVTFLCSTPGGRNSSSSTPGGRVYYTSDGSSMPSLLSESVPCGGRILLRAPGVFVLRALAFRPGLGPSAFLVGRFALSRKRFDEYPAAPRPWQVQPLVTVKLLHKELPDLTCPDKRDIKGRLALLANPLGHFQALDLT